MYLKTYVQKYSFIGYPSACHDKAKLQFVIHETLLDYL